MAAIVAALYAALCIGLGPLSFMQIQVRVANALLGGVPVFGAPWMVGLMLGCFIANTTSPLGPIDLLSVIPMGVLLVILNRLGRRYDDIGYIVGATIYSFGIALWVAFMLWYVIHLPYIISLLYVFAGCMVADVGLGYPVYRILKQVMRR